MTLQPEAQWTVALDHARIEVTDATGAVRGIDKAALSAILIETNDSGPWGTDFWWLFLGPDKALACAVPQGAAGEQAPIDWMLALPGFDHEAMINANGSVENAFFEVWRRG
jgi:hypothetical protein